MLRPGGTLVISLRSYEDGKYTTNATPLGGNLYRVPYGGGHMYVRFWHRDEAVALVADHGFEVVRCGYVLRNVDFDPDEPVAYHTIAAWRHPRAGEALSP